MKLSPQNYRIFNLFGSKILVGQPNCESYGNVCIDIFRFAQLAYVYHAKLVLLSSSNPFVKAAFQLQSKKVEVIPPVGPYYRFLVWVFHCLQFMSVLSTSIRIKKKVSKKIQKKNAEDLLFYHGQDIRKLYAQNEVGMCFSESDHQELSRQAEEIGIQAQKKIVTLHVRESGYRKTSVGRLDRAKDYSRNADIETYYKAVDLLVAQGYQVVRVGDPSMKPAQREGLIDLATHVHRSDALELWCISQSKFFIAGDSGPSCAGWMLGVPVLVVNLANIFSLYPIRRDEVSLQKRVLDRTTGKILTLVEMLDEDFRKNQWDMERFEYISNTDEEILNATQEMLQVLKSKGEGPMDPRQIRYREIVERYTVLPHMSSKFRRGWGVDHPFVGKGRISSSFLKEFALEDFTSKPELVESEQL